MKLRLNQKSIAALPSQLQPFVVEWRKRWGKSAISIAYKESFYIEEDAKFVAFSPNLQSATTARAGGEWAGVTNLMPGSDCPLPAGCTVIASGFFLGNPWLTIYHNPADPAKSFASWQLLKVAPLPDQIALAPAA